MAFPSLVANSSCLELVNTVNNWRSPERDLLDDPSSTDAWARLVLDDEVTGVRPRDLADLRRLRESVRSVFGAVAAGASPDGERLEELLEAHAAGLTVARLHASETAYTLTWPSPVDGACLVARLAASAIELLTHGPLDRVGECPACGWLFLDTSRNGRRSWCSMEVCGSRVKARRYYARRHEPGPLPHRPHQG